MKTMSSLVVGLLCIILILSVAYLIKRVNKLIDYVLGKDDSLINLSVPDTSYIELPDYLFVLSVFSKPINDCIIIGVYSDSDRAREQLSYYKKSFRHPGNYTDYRIDSIPNNYENGDPRRHLRVNGFNRPVVYVVKYIYADAYGSYDEVDVFANEEDAIKFVQKLKDSNLGVSDVSINSRMVYLDKDKTLDNVDNL